MLVILGTNLLEENVWVDIYILTVRFGEVHKVVGMTLLLNPRFTPVVLSSR